jgi:putative tricarboxylic transport membrane protein
MTHSNNPTAVSAVVGEELELGRANPDAALLKQLIMPAILLAFATYLLVGAVLLIVRALRERAEAFAGLERSAAEIELLTDEEIAALDDGGAKRVGVDWGSLAWIVASFIGFALLLPVLGWVVAAALLFWCVAWAFGSRRPVFNLVVGLTASSIAYIAFDMLLGLTLPSGVLGWGF